jgi:methionyl-tRNA synthetase
VCADDAHGTAIMLSAEAANRKPEAHIAAIQAQHERDSAGFLIQFDHYHSTHSPENQRWSETIFKRLEAGGHIAVRDITQAYDPEKGLFLADRFIKGTCPKCKAPDQ